MLAAEYRQFLDATTVERQAEVLARWLIRLERDIAVQAEKQEKISKTLLTSIEAVKAILVMHGANPGSLGEGG